MKGKSIAKIAVALAVIVLAALLALFGLKIPPISEVYGIKSLGAAIETGPVSYTHLDVYKRQGWVCPDEQRPAFHIVTESTSAEFARELCDFCERELRRLAGT